MMNSESDYNSSHTTTAIAKQKQGWQPRGNKIKTVKKPNIMSIFIILYDVFDRLLLSELSVKMLHADKWTKSDKRFFRTIKKLW